MTASQTQKTLEVEANFTRESSGCDGTHYAEGREEIVERNLMQAACRVGAGMDALQPAFLCLPQRIAFRAVLV